MTPTNLKSILLVDDDEISNLFNKIFIRKLKLDIDVEIVLNGQEAIKVLKDKDAGISALATPCLLLLDIKMPIMDGWRFLEVYNEMLSENLKDEIIIVMLTTSEDERDMIKAIGSPNVKEYIRKPLSEEKFIRLLSNHFDKKITHP